MSSIRVPEQSRIARLDPIVQFFPDTGLELVEERRRIKGRMDEPVHAQHRAQVSQIRQQGSVDIRVLHFHRDRPPVGEPRFVHLTDRRCGHRLRIELRERRLDGRAELVLEQSAHPVPRRSRGVVLQSRQRQLEMLAELRRHDAGVDHREHLSELGRGTAHTAQDRDQPFGHQGITSLVGGTCAGVGADAISGAVRGELHRFRADQPTQLRGPARP